MIRLQRNWLALFLMLYGVFVFLPFLAPVLMKWDLPGLAKAIYGIYGFLCHQLPQRSLFLFGPKLMYSLPEIQSAWQNTENLLLLRQFTGTSEMGWKIAWSDRMISMYGGVWVGGLLWAILRKHTRKISIWVFLFLAFPMVLDGVTHSVSDFRGLTEGFRFTNHWLAVLTQGYFADSFYAGDALGSFNSWARWITGLSFGFGFVWWLFPYISEGLDQDTQIGVGKTTLIPD